MEILFEEVEYIDEVTTYGTGNTAAIGMLKNLAEQFLIGIDPFRVEYIWNKMFRDNFFMIFFMNHENTM